MAAVTINSLVSPFLHRCAGHCSRVWACLRSGNTRASTESCLLCCLVFPLLLHLGFLALATSRCDLYLDIQVPSILRAFRRVFEEPLLCYSCYRQNKTKKQNPNQTKKPTSLGKPQSDLCSLFQESRWVVIVNCYAFCIYSQLLCILYVLSFY